MELRKEMKCYVSFTDKDVFSGMALPEEPSITQPREATPRVPNLHRPTPLSRVALQR